MKLLLITLIQRAEHKCGHADEDFFRSAYFWRFQKHLNCIDDIALYRKDGTIPKYVQEYVKNISR